MAMTKVSSKELLPPRPAIDLHRLVYLRDLIRELVGRDLKLRYKRSIIGVGWSLLVPLAQLAALTFVFTVIVPIRQPNFSTFLFCGLLPWSWFSTSLLAATASLYQNKDLIQQVGFPTQSTAKCLSRK